MPALIRPSDAQPPYFLGFDVGGTGIKIGVVDDQGRTVAFRRIATEQESGPADAVRRMAQTAREMMAETDVASERIAAAGLGTPGTMDIPRGMILEPPNLPAWRHYNIRDSLAETLGIDVTFANDAAAAAYGEFWVGGGSEFGSLLMLTLGTGVGGGVIIGDFSLDGQHSHGAECGHIIIDSRPEARVCSCGQPGHLEAYASATAVVARCQEALQAAPAETAAVAQALADGRDLTPLLLAELAEQGDAFCESIIRQTADYLAIGVVSLLHIIDPAVVLIGGAMTFGGDDSPLGQRFLARLDHEVRRRTFPMLAENTVIRYAQLGGDAGYVGAAGLARTQHRIQS